jgi:LEA14-like dessication related protein
MKIDKKYLVAGAIGLVTITGAIAYLQYKRLMNYVIKVGKIKINKISLNNIDFNLILNFENKSDISFDIKSQKYDIYLNNVFIAKVENQSINKINAKAVSQIGLNVKFDPSAALKKLGTGALDLLANSDKIMLKVDVKLKVKLYMFTINIPYIFESSLKDLTTEKK